MYISSAALLADGLGCGLELVPVAGRERHRKVAAAVDEDLWKGHREELAVKLGDGLLAAASAALVALRSGLAA